MATIDIQCTAIYKLATRKQFMVDPTILADGTKSNTFKGVGRNSWCDKSNEPEWEWLGKVEYHPSLIGR